MDSSHVDKRLEDAIALLALAAVDIWKLNEEMSGYEKSLSEARKTSAWHAKDKASPDYEQRMEAFRERLGDRFSRLGPVQMPHQKRSAEFSVYDADVSGWTDDELARKMFTPEGYRAYARCRELLAIVNRLTVPLENDTTVIDREKVARDALEALTPAERTIQMHRYCRDCGRELTHHEHFCESVKF